MPFLCVLAPLRETDFSLDRVTMTENEISGIVVDAAIAIHRALGPGCLESVYEKLLAHELTKRGLKVDRQVPVPIIWDGIQIETAFYADMIVQDLVIVELKAKQEMSRVFRRQLQTYLKLSGKRLGLLINFGSELLKDGIVRSVNGLPE